MYQAPDKELRLAKPDERRQSVSCEFTPSGNSDRRLSALTCGWYSWSIT